MKRMRGFVLGLLVFGALSASPAIASASNGLLLSGGEPTGSPQMEAPKYPAHITGEFLKAEGMTTQTKLLGGIGSQARNLTCSTVSYDGGELLGPASSLSLSTTYSGCTLSGSGGATASVTMNSCHYGYSSPKYFISGSYNFSAEITCNSGDAITAGVKIGSTTVCTLRISPQGLKEAELTNWGSGEVIGVMASSGVKYTAEGANCGLLGISVGSHEEATSESDVLLRGFQMAGGGPPSPENLNAEKYPAHITGEFLKAEGMTTQIQLLGGIGSKARNLNCSAATYNGGELLGPASTTLSLSATYSGCALSGYSSASVTMNSCHYAYSNPKYMNAGAYSFSAEIACNGGDTITVGLTGCTLRITPQALKEAEWANWSSGELIGVTASSGVKYTAEGANCPLAGISVGSHEEATSESDVLLRAS